MAETIGDCECINQNDKWGITAALDDTIKSIKDRVKIFEDKVDEKGEAYFSDDYLYSMHITKTKVLHEYIETREHVKNTPTCKGSGYQPQLD